MFSFLKKSTLSTGTDPIDFETVEVSTQTDQDKTTPLIEMLRAYIQTLTDMISRRCEDIKKLQSTIVERDLEIYELKKQLYKK